jgi:hypothetical protein
MVVVNYHTSLW